MKTTEIVAELNRLLKEQAETIKGNIGPIEAEEYATRYARIHELFALLNEPSRANID